MELKRDSGIIHALGECRDCGKTFDHYKNALALSARHARATGHMVSVEQVLHVLYNPREEATAKLW